MRSFSSASRFPVAGRTSSLVAVKIEILHLRLKYKAFIFFLMFCLFNLCLQRKVSGLT